MSDPSSPPDPFAPRPAGEQQSGQQPYGSTQPLGQQQPYGQPYGQQQPYGQPYGPGQPYGQGAYSYGPPPPPRGTNGFAIAGLVLGILPVLGGILGIIFGAIGLRQTKRTGQNGRGMALAGVILGSLWLVFVVVVIAIAAVSGNSTSTSDTSSGTSGGTSSGSTSVLDIKVGDCLVSEPSGVVTEVDTVPCSSPHRSETYAEFDLTGSSFPGEAAVKTLSEDGCRARFSAFVGKSYEDSTIDLVYLHPSQRSWSLTGDRTVKCFVESPSPTVGTLRNARR